MRDTIDIVIPTERESRELEEVVKAIETHTANYRLHLILRPDLNVAEARQFAMDTIPGRFICFMDSDAHHIQDTWLDEMHHVITHAPDAAAVYCGERWGIEPPPRIISPIPAQPWQLVDKGPAACMIIDRSKVPEDVKWNTSLGLANGWLGGDYEEVEYARQLMSAGLKLYRATNTIFHHRGGRTTHAAFQATDRCQVINVIINLLQYQSAKQIPSEHFWRYLKRIPCATDDDLNFHPSIVSPLRTIFRDVVLSNNLSYADVFRRLGIID
jgi:hypothetical protein